MKKSKSTKMEKGKKHMPMMDKTMSKSMSKDMPNWKSIVASPKKKVKLNGKSC